MLGAPVGDPHTVATAIRIGNPASADKAIRARDESGGTIDAVTDDEILAAYRDLARLEGIFCEPASAASLAGVRKLAADSRIDPGATIVCVLTGHGLKDPDTATRNVAPTLTAAAVTAPGSERSSRRSSASRSASRALGRGFATLGPRPASPRPR